MSVNKNIYIYDFGYFIAVKSMEWIPYLKHSQTLVNKHKYFDFIYYVIHIQSKFYQQIRRKC